MDAFDTYLVLTFVGETRVLAITPDDELDEAELPGFDAEAQVSVRTRFMSQFTFHDCFGLPRVPFLVHFLSLCTIAYHHHHHTALCCKRLDDLYCPICRVYTAATRQRTRSCRSRGTRCGSSTPARGSWCWSGGPRTVSQSMWQPPRPRRHARPVLHLVTACHTAWCEHPSW